MPVSIERSVLKLVFIILLLLVTLSTVQAQGQHERFQWRSIPFESQSPGEWQTGHFANLGFTRNTLEFQFTPDSDNTNSQYLVLSPVYLDYLNVALIDDSTMELLTLGDEQEGQKTDKLARLPGKVAIKLPKNLTQVQIEAASTSNLRLHLRLLNEQELLELQGQLTFGASLLMTLITLSWIVALVSWSLNRSASLLYFAGYQLVWTLLLNGIFFPVLPFNFWSITTNNWVVSAGAILATLTGALTHAQILKEFADLRLASLLLRMVSSCAAVLLVIYLSGYHLIALKFNVLLISVIPLVVILILFFSKSGTERRNLSLSIKFGYLLLMGFVVATGFSGLGAGDLFDITYLHALSATLLLSMILIVGIRNSNSAARERLRKMELEAAQKVQAESQLNENIAMFEMLSHEIKTPLTTLSMMLHGSSNRERAGRQIDAIRTIIEQTGMALNLQSSETELSQINLQRAIMGNWQLLSAQNDGRSLDLRLAKNYWLEADRYLFDILLRNILKNAVKYSTPKTTIRVYTQRQGQFLVLIFSNVSRISYADSSNLFNKYWRAEESKTVRGSGLGLWLVRRIGDISDIEAKALVKRDRFRVILTIKNFGETYNMVKQIS